MIDDCTQCSRELGGFFLMFMIVFVAFDILAYVWFGAQVPILLRIQHL
jgi:hypothetical protein